MKPIKKLLTRATLYLVRKRIITLTKTTDTEGTKFFLPHECYDAPCIATQGEMTLRLGTIFASGPKYRVTRKSFLGFTIQKKRQEIMVFVG